MRQSCGDKGQDARSLMIVLRKALKLIIIAGLMGVKRLSRVCYEGIHTYMCVSISASIARIVTAVIIAQEQTIDDSLLPI